jgi:hypothetical protein
MGNEHPGERWLPMDHADNSRFFQAHDDGVRHRRDRRYALRLPRKTSFTEEIVRSKHCDDKRVKSSSRISPEAIANSRCLIAPLPQM